MDCDNECSGNSGVCHKFEDELKPVCSWVQLIKDNDLPECKKCEIQNKGCIADVYERTRNNPNRFYHNEKFSCETVKTERVSSKFCRETCSSDSYCVRYSFKHLGKFFNGDYGCIKGNNGNTNSVNNTGDINNVDDKTPKGSSEDTNSNTSQNVVGAIIGTLLFLVIVYVAYFVWKKKKQGKKILPRYNHDIPQSMADEFKYSNLLENDASEKYSSPTKEYIRS